MNEIRGGATNYERQDQPAVRWKGGDFPYHPTLHGTSMIVMLRGYTIGADNQNIFQDTQSLRDDLTTSYNWGGHHDVPALQRRHRRDRGGAAAGGRPPVALPGLERRVDVERRAARADYAMGLPLAVGYGASIRHRAASVRRVGAG